MKIMAFSTALVLGAAPALAGNTSFKNLIATQTFSAPSSSITASMLASGAAAANLGYTPVFSNSGLRALPSSVGKAVRLGFAAPGDSPELTYVASGSACSLNSGAGDGGSQVATSDGKCWLAQFPGHAYASQFGANTSAVDNGPAINAWLAMVSPSLELDHDPGVYNFQSLIHANSCTNCVVRGAGRRGTVWNYTGASSTSNLFTWGNSTTNTTGLTFENISISSSTVMPTGVSNGAAMLFYRLSDSTLTNLTTGNSDIDSTRGVNNGIVFAGVHSVHLNGCQTWAQTDGLQVYAMGGLNSDLYVNNCLLYFSGNAGVHVAGGFGGFNIDNSNDFKSGVAGVLIDDAIVASGNMQLFFGANFSNDGNYTAASGYLFNGTLDSNMLVTVAGFIGGNTTRGIDIEQCPYCRINVGQSHIVSDVTGIYYKDATAFVALGGDTSITNNTTGIDAYAATSNIQGFPQFSYNGTNYTANSGIGSQSFYGYFTHLGAAATPITNGFFSNVYGGAGATLYILAQSGQSVTVGGNAAGSWIFDASNNLMPTANNVSSLGWSTSRISTGYFYNISIGPVAITSLPTCNSTTVGNSAFVSNGVTTPTYHLAVSSTGTGQWPVWCTYNGSTYSWVY